MFPIKKSGTLNTTPRAKRCDFVVFLNGMFIKIYTDIHPNGSLNAIGISGAVVSHSFKDARGVVNFLVENGPLFSGK